MLDQLLQRMETELPPAARIEHLVWESLDTQAPADFVILPSDRTGSPRASIPAALAMCDACREST